MPIEYLKKAAKTPETETETARKVVTEMLSVIEAGGEAAVRAYAAKLDGWTGEIMMTSEEIERRIADVPDHVKRDIDNSAARVRTFALAQRDSIRDFSVEDSFPVEKPSKMKPLLESSESTTISLPELKVLTLTGMFSLGSSSKRYCTFSFC